mmetsp:Transcript_1956/g.4519  ORF Transcript_1956/g.4519 Transcript_1956/m.4519 type:complete len:249 (-) Transcript_1956:2270-3016(-)
MASCDILNACEPMPDPATPGGSAGISWITSARVLNSSFPAARRPSRKKPCRCSNTVFTASTTRSPHKVIFFRISSAAVLLSPIRWRAFPSFTSYTCLPFLSRDSGAPFSRGRISEKSGWITYGMMVCLDQSKVRTSMGSVGCCSSGLNNCSLICTSIVYNLSANSFTSGCFGALYGRLRPRTQSNRLCFLCIPARSSSARRVRVSSSSRLRILANSACSLKMTRSTAASTAKRNSESGRSTPARTSKR